jgi:hypothetical protein
MDRLAGMMNGRNGYNKSSHESFGALNGSDALASHCANFVPVIV